MSYGGITGQTPEKLEQELKAHVDNKNNPHDITKEQLGLGNVKTWELIGEETKFFEAPRGRGFQVHFPSSIDYKQLKIVVKKIDNEMAYNTSLKNGNNVLFLQFGTVNNNSEAIIVSTNKYYGENNLVYFSPLYNTNYSLTNQRYTIELYVDWLSDTASSNQVTFNVQLYGLK